MKVLFFDKMLIKTISGLILDEVVVGSVDDVVVAVGSMVGLPDVRSGEDPVKV